MLLPQEKKRRREENLRRRLENERKAEIVQVVSPELNAGLLFALTPSPVPPPTSTPALEGLGEDSCSSP